MISQQDIATEKGQSANCYVKIKSLIRRMKFNPTKLKSMHLNLLTLGYDSHMNRVVYDFIIYG